MATSKANDPLAEHALERGGLDGRIEVTIPPPLLLALVAHPLVDQPLINTFAGAGRDEAVPENVPAPDDRPFRTGERLLQVVARLILGEGQDSGSIPLADACEPGHVSGGAILPDMPRR